MKKGTLGKVLIMLAAIFVVCFTLTACELSEPADASKYYINDNASNALNKDSTTKDQAIDRVTGGIENLRAYLDDADVATTGYYMGVEFNIDTLNPNTLDGGNFRLKIQAHMYTYPYEDEDGNPIYKYYNEKDGKYYDEPDAEGTYIKVLAEDIHNEVIKKSDILLEWYNGATNQMLIGMYFDGLNSNSEDPGNILYLNIQGYKRSFYDFGDTVLYRQLIRLLMSLSVEKLLTAGNIQGDAGTGTIRSLFEVAVNDNYKVVRNDPVTSVLFYGIAADMVAGTLTDFIQGIFKPFENKVDPFMLKYLGFKFSVVGSAIINSVASDMQFFTQPDPSGTKEIMTGAYLTFNGAALSNNAIYNYVSDATFEYGTYPPEDMKLDRDFYLPYEYGQYEFVGNLYVPLLNANYDALIRTDMQQYDNSTNNVFMEYKDIANGELMIGAYYRYEKTFIDISGMEYLYGWIDLNQLGFPRVYDESLNLAEALGSLFDAINNGIISIVDGILSPDKNDKENHLLEEIMKKMSMTEKDPNDIFSKNTETLTIDMVLIKAFLYETGEGSYTTRDIINILDSMLPYTMDQIAIMLGVANAEIMLDNSYFEVTLNVDTNEITIKLLTNVGRDDDESSLMIFQLDITPVYVGQKVDIAEVNFDGFKPLEQIYTYSATMDGNFIFSTAETVDLSKLLSATIGENSGKNTPYALPANAGVTFRLIYDQFVTDHIENDADGNTIVHKAGRSAFQLQMYLTGGSEETDVILRLASDDVAFNSDVYREQPQRAGELGYVWVSIECVKDNNVQRIPKVKIREDVFMSSMQAYLDGTSISDDAAELGKTEVNLSITSILFALIEDSYVVMEPEQMEITSSNETLQNIFRVKGLIGNIRVNAGFRKRVDGLQNIKKDYGMYQVGQFENIEGNSPYDTPLHDDVPVYFYADYLTEYPSYVGRYIKLSDATPAEKEEFGASVYYKLATADIYFVAGTDGEDLSRYESYYDENGEKKPVEYLFGGWYSPYDMRVDKKRGFIQVYNYGAKVTVTRETIENPSGSFFNDEDANNQDIKKVRFDVEKLRFVFKDEKDGKYRYFDYSGEETIISDDYVKTESGKVYIYLIGIQDMMYHAGGTEYYYFDAEYALEKDGAPVNLYASTTRDFLFDYNADSIEITEAAKSQYAPRINGSFMGTIRRYVVTFTTGIKTELGKLVELNAKDYYCEEDENNTVPVYDDKGILIEEVPAPIVLYVMEPCEPLAEQVRVNIQVNALIEQYDLAAAFAIDWDSVGLKGAMAVTEVTVAPGMMGEKTFPVRIIVTNREIDTNDTVTVYTEETDAAISGVPVVDTIEIDPYDYILAKNEYFIDISNYNPDQYGSEGDDPEYMRVYREKERDFVSKYFADYVFDIQFKYTDSYLYKNKVKDEYVATSYSNKNGDKYVWSFDKFAGGNYTEDKITAVAPEGQKFTALYLHTYFKGQLIALQVNVGQRILSHIKFGEEDDFDPVAVNGDKKPGDAEYIYGHYVANYFDESSYILPVNPIFVFTDGANGYYEKIFDMRYVSQLADNGSYVISDGYKLTWGDGAITYIGTNGSYYYEDGVLVNRPFYISNVERDENGTVIKENPPTETANGTDVTSTSINWSYLLAVYKPERSAGSYTGRYIKIPLIAGESYDNGFRTTVLRITAECPKLNVADATTSAGNPVSEADDYDLDEGGNKKVFTPSAIEAGSTPGYYLIDPLDKNTLYIPTSVVINFRNADGTRTSRHRFSNIDWCAGFDANGNPTLYNASGIEILKKQGNAYVFNLSAEEPSTTKIMAKIGSEVSGYQYITLCLRVLSKDPQEVEFFTGSMPDGKQITGIERTDIKYSYEAVGSKDVVLYTYYVNTFADFKMPSFIKAYFGANKDRSEYYAVKWSRLDGKSAAVYNPDSVCNMTATIGTGDVTIEIYLSVVVANHEISKITLADGIGGMYVRIGDSFDTEYSLVGDLVKSDFESRTIGLAADADGAEKYVLVSMGQSNYEGVPAGMIGLYGKLGDVYVLRETLYPYDFVNRVYKAFNIYFEEGKAVTIEDMSKLRFDMTDSIGNEASKVRISEAMTVSYRYDTASDNHDKLDVSFRYVKNFTDYFPKTGENGRITVYKEGEAADEYFVLGNFTVQELAFMATVWEISRDINEKVVKKIVLPAEEIECDSSVAGMYRYSGGKVRFYRPDNGAEFTFVSVTFADGKTMSYEEMLYRLGYYNAHRASGYQVPSVFNKEVSIRNVAGLFSLNDVIRPGFGEAFEASNKYAIGLGTGEGSYDVKVRIIFDGGYRLTVDSESVSEIEISPYSENGYAQYGEKGFVFGDEISASVFAVKRDGAGVEEEFLFGPLYGAGTTRLPEWYVEESTFKSIKKGSFITYVEQGVIYSQTEYGTVTISALTAEGFRIKRKLVLPGAPATLDNFNSVNDAGLLAIRQGTIIIDDIYEYLPMTNYFAGTAYLPDMIKIPLNGNMVDISNVNWKINPAWYGNTEIINGQKVGVGALDVMTYEGTYNSSTGTDDKRLMATAEILGWESVVDGKTVRNDSVKIELYISIRSAEIVELPWNTGNMKLDTTAIENGSGRVYYVEADAYNDAGSSAMSEGVFKLPKNLSAKYRSGIQHLFPSVTYKYRNYEISEIPYDNRGVNVERFVEMFADRDIAIAPSSVNREYVDLTVNVGLSQTLDLRIRFYDKTAETTTAVIDVDDVVMRSAILSSMSALSSAKAEELYNVINQTRIRVNAESLYEVSSGIKEKVKIPSADDVKSDMTAEAIRSLFDSGWYAVLPYDGVPDVEDVVLTNVYDRRSLYNYALKKLKEYTDENVGATVTAIYNAVHSSASAAVKKGNVERILSNYSTSVFNGAFDYVIGEYIKKELSRVFVSDMNKYDSEALGYAVYYKNELEGSFDYDYVIREIYRVREYVKAGMYNAEAAKTAYRAIVNEAIEKAFSAVDSTFAYAGGSVAGKRIASEELREGVKKIFLYRIGLGEEVENYARIDRDVDTFVDGSAAISSVGKAQLRKQLREMISAACNFTVKDIVPAALKSLIPYVVDDNVESIQNFDITVSAIRRNLAAGVDVSSMLDTVVTRGVNNYVKDVYMESLVVREIKKIQKINAEDGYYYIDPYYGYIAVPSKVVVEFDEEKGGFAYVTDVVWNNDTVTGNVTYSGNARNDVYGYVYMWTSITEEKDAEGNYVYADNTLLADIGANTEAATAGKSWAQLKSENGAIANIMLILESDAMINTYYTSAQSAEMGKEACAKELYKRFVNGKALLDTDRGVVDATTLEYDYAKGLFNTAKYTVLNAVLNNANTKEIQTLSMVAVVKDRTLPTGELRVLDDKNNQVTRVEVENPFEYSAKDLPNRIKVGSEYYRIIWNDVSINPLGNLSASTHTVYGNIGNSSGQRVQIELYVYRWEYAGIAKNVGTADSPEYVTMNPVNFYFSESLKYSAESSYQVRFNVYHLDNGEEKLKEYKTVTFYPEDSELLVNTTDDEGMLAVLARKNYVMYWDEMAVNSARQNSGVSVEGDLALGNERVGTHNLTSLSTGSANGKIPKKGYYAYEDMTVSKFAYIAENYGLNGNAVAITAEDMCLPTTAKIKLNVNNINYDEEKLEIRVIWNYSFGAAVQRLINFVEFAYPDVEETMRRQYAINIIMSYPTRSAEAVKEMEELAVRYYKERLLADGEMTETEILYEARQLLMYDEKYDFAANPSDLTGGAVIKNATVLIRYGDSDYIKECGAKVRLLFGDYTPIKYYVAVNEESGTPDYDEVSVIASASDAPTELYIGVRMKYWDEANGRSQYETEGIIAPYDNIDASSYKLLDAAFTRSDEDTSVDLINRLRRVKVSDVIYGGVTDGYLTSESFVLGGVRYKSNLIKIRVA